MDFVFPNNNEKDFFKIAENIGTEELCLVYNKPTKIDSFRSQTAVKLFSGILCNSADARKLKGKADIIFVRRDENIRSVLEQGSADVIFDLEQSNRSDSMHNRNSGLNQVLCELAFQKGVALGLNFSTVINSSGRERAVLIGRMAQNIMFANKFKFRTIIASFASFPFQMRSEHDLRAFGSSIGMTFKCARKQQIF
jgi:RNase P/RNase MRP subunit p30